MLYTEDSREVVFLRRPFVLLRFRKPEYDFKADGGTVTWPINRGVLVAQARPRPRLPAPQRPPQAGRRTARDEVTVAVSSEVVNFYPAIAARASAAGSTSRPSCAST